MSKKEEVAEQLDETLSYVAWLSDAVKDGVISTDEYFNRMITDKGKCKDEEEEDKLKQWEFIGWLLCEVIRGLRDAKDITIGEARIIKR